ncbi:MAG: hypothetical protein ACFCVG_09495 [Kineosporiaceae bacterium]
MSTPRTPHDPSRRPPGAAAPEADRPAVPAQTTRAHEVGDTPPPVVDPARTRQAVVERERQEHGGLKAGSAFLGWLTATGAAILLTGLVSAAGTAIGVAFPRIPVNEGELTTAGWVAIALAALASLAGAVLGGVLGTRYHRRVDRTGFGG